MRTAVYKELKLRLAENRYLGKGGLGRWRGGKWAAEKLAVHPWKLVVPAAVGMALLSWWVWRERMTLIVLRVFGGP